MRLLARLAHTAGVAVAVALLSGSSAAAAGLRDGFQAALPLNAGLRALEARRAVPLARADRAAALTPGAPAITLGYRSDRMFQDRGLREYEAEAGVPLWLPGESRALRSAAEAQRVELEARILRQRLAVAGEVRAAWWDWMAATAVRTALQARVAAAAALERDTARQVAAGNLATVDGLVATASLREAQAALREQELALQRATIAFRTLTGLSPTAGPTEQPATSADLDPRTTAARATIDYGRAAERLAQLRTRANPEIGLQLRQERDSFSQPWGSRAALLVTIPLSYSGAQRERIAEARAQVAAGNAGLATLERVLPTGVERAREAQASATARANLADARHGALSEQVRLVEAAWRAGQTPLIELVRARSQLAESDAARRLARVQAGRAVSALNQALGVEPQ